MVKNTNCNSVHRLTVLVCFSNDNKLSIASCNLPSCDRRMHKYSVRYIYCYKLTTGKSCFCTSKMFKSLFQVGKLAKGLANAKNTSMLASIITNKYLRVCVNRVHWKFMEVKKSSNYKVKYIYCIFGHKSYPDKASNARC